MHGIELRWFEAKAFPLPKLLMSLAMTQRIKPITSSMTGGCATVYATDAGFLLFTTKSNLVQVVIFVYVLSYVTVALE